MMIPSRNILRIPLRLTAATVFQCLKPNETPSISRHLPPPISRVQRFSADSAATESPRPTRCSELTRVATLVDGCDYQHWLVVVEPPEGYPERSQIVDHFITTLALALGSEEEAKRSIYSVSTKYYYAFGCKVSENLIHKVKSLSNVRWVLPDSYFCHMENDYGVVWHCYHCVKPGSEDEASGEPFGEGEVVPYDEKYHADWLRNKTDDKYQSTTRSRKSRRKERKKMHGLQTLESTSRS
ncbi:hypothetical protein RHGRI_035397 [Rhododendron griersonianum]|uniref:MORF/ORRM1/DAG-like MORF domain-containing protein n=1 Tax=Rhododendron griersonianum TaxID=479676 RepID=A0AAV6I924_9ERIC|nr:hypothetical protein RHGRI_035397 [Rhododendron griersonianum]